MIHAPTIEPAGADAVLILFNHEPSERTSLAIIDCLKRIESHVGDSNVLIDSIPGWDSLLLHYNPRLIGYRDLEKVLLPLINEWETRGAQSSSCDFEHSRSPVNRNDEDAAVGRRIHCMPVLYDGEDLPTIAKRSGLTVDEVIAVHQAGEYYVGAVGFVPGFAYLGGLDKRLMGPRRDSPRVAVPKGSVAIAEAQTSIYPEVLPGGWNLIGRCPLRLYDHQRQPPGRFQVGDKVHFVAIDESRFHQLEDLWSWEHEQNKAQDNVESR